MPPRIESEPEIPQLAEKRTDLIISGVVLRIAVTGEASLSQPTVRVDPSGRIYMPFLGGIEAEGKTPVALADALRDAYKDRGFLKRPDVRVDVLEASGRRVYVLGSVRHPGAFDLPFNRTLTLVQVIALAGGIGQASDGSHALKADPSAVRLIRNIEGTRRTYRLSLLEILDEGKLASDVPMQDGDVLFVPPMQELFIFGSVQRPGGFQLANGSRLAVDEVLGLAGGFTDNADRDGVLLIRRSARGGVTYRIPTDPRERAAVEVTANDTIIVPARSVSRVFVLGSVARQGGIPLDSEGLTVTKALALAGGLSRIASANSVELIRTVDGERKVYPVPVADIIAGGDVSLDPVLLPGDLIWVPEGFF